MTMMMIAAPSIAKDIQLTPHAKIILRHLHKRGNISPMQALNTYGIYSLAGRIHELRHKGGYNIRAELRRDEAGHRYARYFLGDHNGH
jgi:hypothetical protein